VTLVKGVFFPLDHRLKLSKHVWSPQTIQQAVRLAVEIPSHRRAAEAFSELTGVGISKSSLQRLCEQAGGKLVAKQNAEAKAMVEVPKHDEVVRRKVVLPDSEVMSVSSDGVMVCLRKEGWKEVKVASVSAVEQTNEGPTLKQHSYRAGLWEASLYGQHLWTETCRRGLEKARTVVCVSDGAIWIWNLMFMCFAVRVEILDWWHAVQRLWTIANARLAPDAAIAWVAAQQQRLAHTDLRHVIRQVRLLYPRATPLPSEVRQAVAYLFANRHRMRYRLFRQAGYPIGSGTVESACKVVVQQRMKQAGMRWSRPGAQAMLALRSTLLSNRWHHEWMTLF
jgi:hypothetical protein